MRAQIPSRLQKPFADLINLPTAIDLEEAVLGAILVDATICALIKTIFTEPNVFSSPKWRLVFQACLHLDKQNKPIDLLTVHQEIKRRGKTKLCAPEELTILTGKVASGAQYRIPCPDLISILYAPGRHCGLCTTYRSGQ